MARRADDSILVEEIYAAALEPGRWQAVLNGLRRIAGADSAAMSMQHITLGTGTRVDVGYENTHTARYFDGFAGANPLFQALLRLPAGVPRPHQSLIEDSAFRGSAYFNEYCRPHNLHFLAGVIVNRDASAATWLTVNRGREGSAFDPTELRRLARLVPHLRRATHTARMFDEARARQTGWMAALDALTHAVVLLDRRQSVVFANRAARTLAAQCDAIVLRRDRIAAPHAAARFDHAIAHATDGDAEGVCSGSHLALPRTDHAQPLSAIIQPLPHEERLPLDDAPAAMLLISDPVQQPIPDISLLRTMFQLTEREAALTASLASGHTLAQAASQLGMGRETARTHLAHALDKTGSERQADLMRLALAASPPVRRN